MFSPRTDLAMEAAAMLNRKPEEKLCGVEEEREQHDNIGVTRVKITNEEGEKIIGKVMGNYVTLEYSLEDLYAEETKEKIVQAFNAELSKLIEKYKHDVIFVVGLGNRFITPDALGPGVSDRIEVNRHLSKNNSQICTVSPGVLGITGIETGEIIEGITSRIKPDIIIAIDALASRSMERICTTIQLADTGITPGAGVGNRRKELSVKTLGIPVIAIGVPTVVDAATVANDSVELILEKLRETSKVPHTVLDEENRYALIRTILKPYFGELIVTPSEIDSVIEKVADIIAQGINLVSNNISSQ